MGFLPVFRQVLVLLVFIALGYILSRMKIIDSKHSKLLSVLGVYLFLPSHIFHTFATNFTVSYITEKYYYLIISTIILICLMVISHFAANLITKEPYQRKIYEYTLIVPNFGYLGYALAASLTKELTGYGDLSLNVIVFSLPILIYTHSIGFCSLTNRKLNFRSLLNPPLIGMVLGAIAGLTGIYTNPFVVKNILPFIDPMITKASDCMGPVSMILTGIVISEFNVKELITSKVNYLVAALRLLVIPIAIGYILKFTGFNDAIIPAIMIYAMSCGLNTIVFPRLVGENCKNGASLTLISNVFVCATVPLCVFLFT